VDPVPVEVVAASSDEVDPPAEASRTKEAAEPGIIFSADINPPLLDTHRRARPAVDPE